MLYYKNENNEIFAYDKAEENVNGYTSITDGEKDSILEAKQLEIENSKTYIELRQAKYPSIEEQMDMQYWDMINGTTVWKDTIEAIKAEIPKPESN